MHYSINHGDNYGDKSMIIVRKTGTMKKSILRPLQQSSEKNLFTKTESSYLFGRHQIIKRHSLKNEELKKKGKSVSSMRKECSK